MAVGVLQITHYPPDGSSYRTTTEENPRWDVIESAIRRLDRDEWPFIWIFRSVSAHTENDLADFEVLGGHGAYWVAIRGHDYELKFHDATLGKTEIDIWLSDQGGSCPASETCPDIERVLAAAKCFYDSGDPLESFPWVSF